MGKIKLLCVVSLALVLSAFALNGASGEVTTTGAPVLSTDTTLDVSLTNGSKVDLPVVGGSFQDLTSLTPGSGAPKSQWPSNSGPGQLDVLVKLSGADQPTVNFAKSNCEPGTTYEHARLSRAAYKARLDFKDLTVQYCRRSDTMLGMGLRYSNVSGSAPDDSQVTLNDFNWNLTPIPSFLTGLATSLVQSQVTSQLANQSNSGVTPKPFSTFVAGVGPTFVIPNLKVGLTGITSGSIGGTGTFTASNTFNNVQVMPTGQVQAWVPIGGPAFIGGLGTLIVPTGGTESKDIVLGGNATCPTCTTPGRQTFSQRLAGSAFANFAFMPWPCNSMIFGGAGLGVNSWKGGVVVPGLGINLTTGTHTDVTPAFDVGIDVPIRLGGSALSISVIGEDFLSGSRVTMPNSNSAAFGTAKAGNTAGIYISLNMDFGDRVPTDVTDIRGHGFDPNTKDNFSPSHKDSSR